ncbi:hypothetical protein [Salinimicrobium sediminilitoris]|uniref:hypothetical protein n=1 Tax=Salinimicrobium sediminilitoris TaxID=2876715 RepID=UPI001E35EBD8|nr:hypothetical protein [Salinimicrobium sediminilitoris]MCC8360178.1 hypothetical protein [Salinimicrobium sediminilitoris]
MKESLLPHYWKISAPGIFLVLITTLSCSPKIGTTEIENQETQFWTLEKAKKQAADFNSSETWDTETLNMEIEYIDALTSQDLPLFPSPFPTPMYDSPGNGNGPIKTEIAGKSFRGHYAIIGKGEHSKHLFKSPEDESIVYFSILSIADGKENENPVSAISRNHPHYLSQGSINTSTRSRVDWVAVQLADQNAYAIVNSRLFDLRAGRLILVAPQKDGSIRFYQTDAPPMNLEEQEEYIRNLPHQQKLIDFLNNENNI